MPRRRASTRRKVGALGLAVVGLAGLSIASAAQLNITSDTLAAGSTTVAACQTSGPIRATFTTSWTGTPAAYRATAVVLSGIDYACNGASVKVTLPGTTPAVSELSAASITVPVAGNGTVTLAIPAAQYPTAATITSVAVVIQK
jgi:hypothetical protein